MISLLQQTAPAAVETTTTTTTVTVPLSDAPAAAATPATPVTVTETPPVTEAPAVTVTPAPAADAPVAAAESQAAQTHATDSIIVPNPTGADHAAPVAQPGMGHAPTSMDGGHVAGASVPGTDATHAVAGGHDAAASAGMPQLDFSTFGNQIFWLLIALAAIYLILSRVALPRISRILADRQGMMTSDLAAAEDFKRKARDAEAAYDKALADARAEAGKIVAAQKAEIDAELKTAIAKADAEISARASESEKRIGEIRQSAATDARSVAQDVTAELVRAFGVTPDSGAVNAAVDARLKGAAQ